MSPTHRTTDRIVSNRRTLIRTAGLAGVASLAGLPAVVGGDRGNGAGSSPALSVVGSFPAFHVTGVAVSGDGRVFVNQPRFPWAVTDQDNRPRDAANVDVSVAEIRGGHGNALVPYPNAAWNEDGWDQDTDSWDETGTPAAETFVNIQSVYIDPANPQTLWILDTGNPELSADPTGIVADGPKLVEVDLATDSVERTVFFDENDVDGTPLTPSAVDEPGTGDDANEREAYLNDVRVTTDQRWAFMTDSELGALVVTDLEASDGSQTQARRLFDDPADFPATHDEDLTIPVGPHEAQSNPVPIGDVHADGVAIDDPNEHVYFHALSGYELYRSPVSELTDFGRPETDIAIQNPARTDATDGMIADDQGVYHTDLEHDRVTRWNYGSGDGTETILTDDHFLHWPDSFAFGPDGGLYVTASKIHLESTGTRRRPFRVFRIGPRDL